MRIGRWGSALLVGALVAGGVTAGGTAATAADAEQVSGATLDWGYSAYAQSGVMAPWQMSAEGDDLQILQVNGQTVSGDPAEAGRTYNVASFAGGAGSIDPESGAGTISWQTGAVWKVQPTTPLPTSVPSAVLLSDPELTIAADGSGELTFEVAATAGATMTGGSDPAVDPARVTVATFSEVALEDGAITATPDFAGVDYPNGADQIAEGGSWPESYVDHIPAGIRGWHYLTGTSALNLKKAPLPFTVQTGLDFGAGGETSAEPKIELFDAEGDPLGDQVVEEGDLITFRGTGFDPEANNPGGEGAGVPIPDNRPQGVFIAFGSVAEPWQPSQNGPAENRTQVRANTKWALLDSVMSELAEPLQTTIRKQAVVQQPDGSFEGQIVAAEPEKLPANGAFGVYTYAGGAGHEPNAAQELFVPVNFAASGEGEGESEAPEIGKELVWGFKESWRGYVSGAAAGTTTPGSGASVDESGLFHFALDDASGYDASTGEGVVKYDGRVRFMSSLHEFDIVMEKPWVVFGDGGSTITLSLGMSQTETVGDLSVSRVDVARFTDVPAGTAVDLGEDAGEAGGAGSSSTEVAGIAAGAAAIEAAADAEPENVSLAWSGLEGTFLDTVQPETLRAMYAGQATDALAFAFSTALADDEGGEEPEGAAGAGGSGSASGDGSGADADGSDTGTADAGGSGANGSDDGESDAGEEDSAGSLATTGASAYGLLAGGAVALLLCAVGAAFVARRRIGA